MKTPRHGQFVPRASIACRTCRKRKSRWFAVTTPGLFPSLTTLTYSSGHYPTCHYCRSKEIDCIWDNAPPAADSAHSPTQVPALAGAAASSPHALGATEDASQILPPKDVQLNALRCFFEHFVDAGLFTFLHRSLLIESLLRDEASLEVLLGILALSARFCPEVAALFGGDANAAAAFFAQKALEIVRKDPDSATLTQLQCLLMLVLYECCEGHEARSWMLLTTAIRLAMLLKLARSESLDDGIVGPSSLPGAPTTAISSESRRRTYWATFVIARLLCDGHERPSMLHFHRNATIRMPRSDADFEYQRWGLAARFEKDVPVWARASASDLQEPQADLFGHLLRVAALWSKVISYLGAGGKQIDRRAPWLSDSTFAEYHRDLHKWRAALPVHYQYSEANLEAHLASGKHKIYALVHLTYFATVLCLSRDYIPFYPPMAVYRPDSGTVDGDPLIFDESSPQPPGFWSRCIGEAFESADAITALVSRINTGSLGGSLLAHPFGGISVLGAATIHCHQHWFSPTRDPRYLQAAMQDASLLEYVVSTPNLSELDVTFDSAYRHYWPIAIQWCRGLSVLFDQYGQHRETQMFATPQSVPGVSSPPWTLSEGVGPPARKRHDLFALLVKDDADVAQAEMLPHRDPTLAADPEPSTLFGGEAPFDVNLSSFTDWAISGIGNDPSSSWWLT